MVTTHAIREEYDVAGRIQTGSLMKTSDRSTPAGAPMIGLNRFVVFALALIMTGFMTGCMPGGVGIRVPQVVAGTAGFEAWRVATARFDLQTWYRSNGVAGGTLVVYVEGDGRAFDVHGRPSRDPTPRNATALELAVRDPADTVLYVARPCQYVGGDARGCRPEFWSSHRYSRVVVDAVHAVLAAAQARWHPEETGLIGFSGGGAIAAIVHAERKDVDWLVTVAGNLDHARWTRHHEVSPLAASLNAVAFAARTGRAPQLHLRGANDTNILAGWANAYREASAHPDAVRVRIVEGYDHACCWAQQWPELLCSSGFTAHPACASP
jgi:dienelactone hydrolase